MKLFRKLAINVHSGVENIANRFENKEALSLAYIQEYERAVAKAKVKQNQVEGEVNRLKNEESALQKQIEIWANRARRVHKADEKKALECVARMDKLKRVHAQAAVDRKETEGLKKRMDEDVDHILKKMGDLKRKHQNLAGRQVCVEAVQILKTDETTAQHEVDDLFIRWETDIVAKEIHGRPPAVELDSLADEFDIQEQEEALRQTLEQIIASPEQEEEETP